LPSLRKTSPGVAVGGSPAFVFRADPTDDLAVIGSGYHNAKIAVFRAADDARAGEGIVAMGFPYGGLISSQVTVTTGTISSTAGIGDDRRYFQITAPIQPGNSGGPLIDMSGLVVGVVRAKLNALKVANVTGDIPENVNFAIKGSVVRSFLQSVSIQVRTAPRGPLLDAADIAAAAKEYPRLVECWN
jgi:S1-C subfamily serine protease